MTDETSGRWPFLDLLVAVGLVVATLAAVFGTTSTAIRLTVGVPTLLVVPGYAIIAALYPRTRPERDGRNQRDDSEPHDRDADQDGENDRDADQDGEREKRTEQGVVGETPVTSVPQRALTPIERFGLSMATSLVVVGVVTLAAGFTPWGISAEPILIGVAGVTLVAVVAAVGARLRVWPGEQPVAGVGRREAGSTSGADDADGGRIGPFRRDSTGATLLNVAVVLSVVAALALVAFQPFGSPVSGGFSEYYLLAEGEDGELTAANYPTEFTEGEAGDPIFVQVQNHEGQAMEYTVVAQLQAVDLDESANGGGDAAQNETERALNVTQTEELDRFDVAADAGESATIEHEPVPTTTEDVRLVYLFYEGDAPDEPTEETADESLHLWIDVTDPDEEQ